MGVELIELTKNSRAFRTRWYRVFPIRALDRFQLKPAVVRDRTKDQFVLEQSVFIQHSTAARHNAASPAQRCRDPSHAFGVNDHASVTEGRRRTIHARHHALFARSAPPGLGYREHQQTD